MFRSVFGQARQSCLAYAVLTFILIGCRANEAKTDGPALPVGSSVGVDRLSDIHDATRTCELATAISKRPSKFEECISLPDAMVEDLENEFMNAFQKNPACKGITLFVGTDDATKASAIEEQQKISQAKYRLHFHLAVTKEGDVNWRDSEWQLERTRERKSVYGKM